MDAAVAKRIGALVPRIEAIQKKDWRCASSEESGSELLAQLFKHTCTVQQLEKFVGELESRKAACKTGYPLYVREICEHAVKGCVVVSDSVAVQPVKRRFVVHLDRALLRVLDRLVAEPNGCACRGHGYVLVNRGRIHRQKICACQIGQEVQRFLDKQGIPDLQREARRRPLLKLMRLDHTEFPVLDHHEVANKKRSGSSA